jgi:isopenicillin N synthase-like dioxygenase
MAISMPSAGSTAATIPVIDLAPHLAGAPGALDRAAAELRDALERVGFFFIVGHGVPAELVQAVYAQARRFHALPLADKLAMPMTRDNTGYKPLGSMTSRASAIDAAKKPNQVAALFMKRDLPPDHPDVVRGVRFRGLNRWPDLATLPGFRETCVTYQRTMEGLGQRLLPLFARALDLPGDFFAEPFRDADITLRLSHYPPAEYEEGQFGLAPHTDSSFMTFLPDNDVPGLEIRPQGADWMPATGVAGSFLVNSGDTLKRWSNDRFLSTEHRARTRGADRYAVPFFMSPRVDYVMECLPTCHGPGNPARHAPITYGDYIAWFTGQNYHGEDTAPPPR